MPNPRTVFLLALAGIGILCLLVGVSVWASVQAGNYSVKLQPLAELNRKTFDSRRKSDRIMQELSSVKSDRTLEDGAEIRKSIEGNSFENVDRMMEDVSVELPEIFRIGMTKAEAIPTRKAVEKRILELEEALSSENGNDHTSAEVSTGQPHSSELTSKAPPDAGPPKGDSGPFDPLVLLEMTEAAVLTDSKKVPMVRTEDPTSPWLPGFPNFKVPEESVKITLEDANVLDDFQEALTSFSRLGQFGSRLEDSGIKHKSGSGGNQHLENEPSKLPGVAETPTRTSYPSLHVQRAALKNLVTQVELEDRRLRPDIPRRKEVTRRPSGAEKNPDTPRTNQENANSDQAVNQRNQLVQEVRGEALEEFQPMLQVYKHMPHNNKNVQTSSKLNKESENSELGSSEEIHTPGTTTRPKLTRNRPTVRHGESSNVRNDVRERRIAERRDPVGSVLKAQTTDRPTSGQKNVNLQAEQDIPVVRQRSPEQQHVQLKKAGGEPDSKSLPGEDAELLNDEQVEALETFLNEVTVGRQSLQNLQNLMEQYRIVTVSPEYIKTVYLEFLSEEEKFKLAPKPRPPIRPLNLPPLHPPPMLPRFPPTGVPQKQLLKRTDVTEEAEDNSYRNSLSAIGFLGLGVVLMNQLKGALAPTNVQVARGAKDGLLEIIFPTEDQMTNPNKADAFISSKKDVADSGDTIGRSGRFLKLPKLDGNKVTAQLLLLLDESLRATEVSERLLDKSGKVSTLDCLWQLYCKDLEFFGQVDGVPSVVAKLNSVIMDAVVSRRVTSSNDIFEDLIKTISGDGVDKCSAMEQSCPLQTVKALISDLYRRTLRS